MHVQDGTIVKYGGVFIKGDLISWKIKNRNTAAIGVFDSGVGGLTVTREIMRQLPNENVVYFGDTARVPYGSKSKNNIIRFSRQIIRFLKTKNVKAIVIACNTASALALDTVQEEFDIPIIGVIVPGARAAVRETKNGQIGVLGTEATIKSETYTKEIRKIMPEAEALLPGAPAWRGLAGYSLAGLFALYALYQTDVFARAASMSGSFWFEGIMEYVCSHEMKRKPDCLYFSLGDKESSTDNPILNVVQQNTQEIETLCHGKGIETTSY